MAHAIDIKVDTEVVRKALGEHAPKQFPYTFATAINTCLFAARKQVFARLPEVFHIRTKWMPRGLHVNMATKHTVQGSLGFLENRWFMLSQVTGWQGRTKPGDKPIWQPLSTGPKSPRPNVNRRILASRRPNVAQEPNFYGSKTAAGNVRRNRGTNKVGYIKLIEKQGGLYPGIYYRPRGERKKLVAAYWMQQSQDIKPRLDLDGEVADVIGREYAAAVTLAVARALTPRGGTK